MRFSFTIADPLLEDCPLIGCSTGFSELCGYTMEEIVGNNCRFLIDPVPTDRIDFAMRRRVRDFCTTVREGGQYTVPACDLEPWMPLNRPANELFCVQTNAHKDGRLFRNMFLLKALILSEDCDGPGRGGRPYIVGLQSELMGGMSEIADMCSANIELLTANMVKVQRTLVSEFFMSVPMERQDGPGYCDDN